jgi:hypothetical protein
MKYAWLLILAVMAIALPTPSFASDLGQVVVVQSSVDPDLDVVEPFLNTAVPVAQYCIENPDCNLMGQGTPCDSLHPVCICRRFGLQWVCTRP